MSLIVQKYGGTSVADLERIRNVANLASGGPDGLRGLLTATADEDANSIALLASQRAWEELWESVHRFHGDRAAVRWRAAMTAIDMLRQDLMEQHGP